jgi:hypothetical protein
LDSQGRLSNLFSSRLAIRAPHVSGKTYFVGYETRSNVLTRETTWSLKLVAETQALEVLGKCTYAVPEADKAGEQVATSESEPGTTR